MALVYVYYIYSDPSGDPYDSRIPHGFLLSKDTTVDVLLRVIMANDPPNFKEHRLSLSHLGLYESKGALEQGVMLRHHDSLCGLGKWSEPILVVPHISTLAMVVLERQRHDGKKTEYETLGRRMCTLICDHLNARELRKFAESAREDPRCGFIIRDPHGFKVPLHEETAGGLYKCAVNDAHYHLESDASGAGASARCIHVILVDGECFDEKVQLSSSRIAELFPFENVESKIFEGGDLLTVSKSSLPAAISIELLIPAAELVLYSIRRFQGLQKEQLARTIASIVLYTAMQLVVLDAEGQAAHTGRMAQQAVASDGGGEEEGEGRCAATASPIVERLVGVGAATARKLVMVEEMPVQPGTVLEINRKRICITGSHDYVVAHVAQREVVGNASSDGGLVVIEVKRPDKFEECKSFSQAIAGAAAIHHNRKTQGRGLGESGGPLHVVKTDGIRWQCGRVMEKIGQCPDVLLGQVVTLNFSGDWPVNVREVVNYLGKVLRESLKTSPRVSEESVLSGARSSGVM